MSASLKLRKFLLYPTEITLNLGEKCLDGTNAESAAKRGH